MHDADDNIALHKKLLVARSALCRLEILHETQALRDSLTWRHFGTAAVRSPVGRSALFFATAQVLGTARVARWITFASRALMAMQLTTTVIGIVRHQMAGPEKVPRPGD